MVEAAVQEIVEELGDVGSQLVDVSEEVVGEVDLGVEESRTPPVARLRLGGELAEYSYESSMLTW